MLRAGPELRPGLRVILAVAFDETRPQGLDNHGGRFVETFPRFVHADAEGFKLASGQSPAKTEPQASVAQQVKDGGILRYAQRVVPGEDHGGGAHVNVGMFRGDVGHQLQVVRHEGIIVEVVLGRPEAIEP